MTFKIVLSAVKALPFDFKAEVEKHAAALMEHRTKEGVEAPSVIHPWVEAAVSRVQHPVSAERPDDFISDYVITDDTPPPPTLEQRKTVLADEASHAAIIALNALVPPRKRNLFAFRHRDALAAFVILDRKMAEATMSKADFEILASPHRVIMAEHEDREAKVQAVYRKLAQVHSDIDDLTDETVDGWKLPPF
jgi:hypothetical protein